jgi:hypothetical protein
MSDETIRVRQLVDWSAALWSGAIAGTVLLLLHVLWLPTVIGGNMWVIFRCLASIVMGDSILPVDALETPDPVAIGVGTALLYAIAILAALAIALVVHRGGLVLSAVVGALLGIGLCFVLMAFFTYYRPWLLSLAQPAWLACFAIYGGITGALYELLEVEEFVRVDAGGASPDGGGSEQSSQTAEA